jgi:LPXTG-site transpeptidase (sortase) family protein
MRVKNKQTKTKKTSNKVLKKKVSEVLQTSQLQSEPNEIVLTPVVSPEVSEINVSKSFEKVSFRNSMIIFLSIISLIVLISLFLYKSIFDYSAFTNSDTDKIVNEATIIAKQKVEADNENKESEEESSQNAEFYNSIDRLIIPKIGLNVGVFYGSEEVLDKGIWAKNVEIANPVDGGNFILSGHRFTMASTIESTRLQSPLLNADVVGVGDVIYLVWRGDSYKYTIVEKFTVSPTDIWIEADNFGDVLTLYTCTLGGENDGRVVFRAKLQGQK